MEEEVDFYAALQVAHDASQEAIRGAYKRLARATHPDKNSGEGAKEAFQLIANAYDTLGDKARRKAYDAKRRARETRNRDAGFPRAQPRPRNEASWSVMARGDDVRLACVYVDIADVYAGQEIRVRYRAWDKCLDCGPPGEREVPCPACRGRQCWQCNNRGTVRMEPDCPSCGGGGLCRVERAVKVRLDGPTVYAASNPRSPMCFPGEGSDARLGGSQRGDLFIIFVILHMPPYMEMIEGGHSLRATIGISFMTALLGGTMLFPHVNGSTVEAVFQAGDTSPLQEGAELRLDGLGMPARIGRGDLYVATRVQMPTAIYSYREMFEAMDEHRREEEDAEENCASGRKRARTGSQ